jgi:hypothetical protein
MSQLGSFKLAIFPLHLLERRWKVSYWVRWSLNMAEQAVPIRKVINGAPVQSINPATLRNPDCLAEYVKLGEEMRKAEGM